MHFGKSWTTAPAIVAESLVGVPDVLLTALHPGPPASGTAVASALAQSLSPPEYPAVPPPWLLPGQVRSFRRVLAAIRRFRGALLANPVGSGKTYVALAVAAAVNRGPTACLVPAALVGQWQATAARLSVPVRVSSHEQVSRGRLPAETCRLVVIDESHHFRNPETLRYRYLAPWLVGRTALLLSATPVVNRVMDLIHQLLLAVRDDSLALNGVPSLRAMGSECPHPALGQLVLEQVIGNPRRPSRVYTNSMATELENSTISRTLDGLDRLRLSSSSPVAALIRGVLARALASSPAAYAAALRRYRGLLLHARDAEQAGHTFDRAALRRFTEGMEDQLVLWELLSGTEVEPEMELGDLGLIQALLAEAPSACPHADGKLQRLRRLLTDGEPTLVFSGSRETVGYLRRQLRDLGIAWCTGERAGIAGTTLSRQIVLNWFREHTDSSLAPRHLVVTDVAAEGLDLLRAARVVHYDLPWTPMRLEQREGRSVRYGSRHGTVEVVQFRLPPALEQRLGIEAALARKERLPAFAGLGLAGRGLWRWRGELAERYGDADAQPGVARIESERSGLLAGFALCHSAQAPDCTATVVWLEPGGRWTEDPEVVEAQLEVAAGSLAVNAVPPSELRVWLSLLTGPIRNRLAFTRSRRWIRPEPHTAARQLASRLQLLLKTAARQRDARQLAGLEGAMAFVAGGHTAGEAALVERLVRTTDGELRRLLPTLPASARNREQLEVRVNGLVVFGPAFPGAAGVLSPE